MHNAVGVIFLYMLSRDIYGQVIQNVALRKSAIQYERTETSTTAWPANNAIDGYSSCGTSGQSASAYGPSPWWQVDLLDIYAIQRIVVHGRTDNKTREQLTGFHVYMSTSKIKSIGGLFPIYKNTEYNGDVIRIENINTRARFCRLEIPNIDGLISLCEVEIYGIPVKSLLQVHNTQLIPEMSSTFDIWTASKAIDNNPSQMADHCLCCSATVGVGSQWWKVDLLKKYRVSMIEVYGRTDTHKEQSADFEIFIGNFSFISTDFGHMKSSVHGNGVYTTNYITPVQNNGVYTINYITPVTFQYIAIFKQTGIMTICEVKIFEADPNIVQRNIDFVNATMSSKYYNWVANNAIDNVPSALDINTCNCCSATSDKGTDIAWWQLDLGKQYLVSHFKVVGRNDSSFAQSANFSFAIHNSSMNSIVDGENVDTYRRYENYVYTIIFAHPRLLQNIIVSRDTASLMVVCEVMVFDTECQLGKFGDRCSNKCGHCFSGACDSVTGLCTCTPGWQGNTCDTNVDECSTHKVKCGTHGVCKDAPGNFMCSCQPGYTGDGYRCSDIDECVNLQTCHTDATCTNSQGSYSCACNAGFTGDGDNCNDIDECATNPGTCHTNAKCTNTQGSYQCLCNPGYTWNGHKCKDLDECSTKPSPCDEHATCSNVIGSYECKCNTGYVGNGTLCDESILRREQSVSTSMSSTAGRFTSDKAIDGDVGPDSQMCNCCSMTENSVISWWMVDLMKMYPVKEVHIFGGTEETVRLDLTGFQLVFSNTSGDEWQVVYTGNISNFGNVYVIPFTNVLTRFIKIQRVGVLTLCEIQVFEGDCLAGWFGDECVSQCHCLDQLPCDRNTGQCQSSNCEIGWHGTSCQLECENGTYGLACRELCKCAGSQRCTPDYGRCIDIDGCVNLQTCHTDATCTNSQGSYSCACNTGFSGDGHNCTDIDECATNPGTCHTNAKCTNTQGSYQCSCKSGFTGNGHQCEDLNECNTKPSPCDEHATCSNVIGSYECKCNTGYNGNGTFCDDINECKTDLDTCHTNAVCTNMTGSRICTCKTGYLDDRGTCKDVDECNSQPPPCDEHATCRNGIGSYECKCNTGYNGNGTLCDESILRREQSVSTSMSSIAGRFTSDKAIDGDVGPDSQRCNCCSMTGNSVISWWMVDLMKMYPVKEVLIFGGNEETVRIDLTGFQLVFSNTSGDEWHVVYTGNISNFGNVYLIPFTNLLTRFIKIQRVGVLTLCEIQVFEGDCPAGWFGDECVSQCHCLDQLPCDRNTGQCQSSNCEFGWHGTSCQLDSTIAHSTSPNERSVIIGAVTGSAALVLIVCIVAIIICRKRCKSSEDNTVDGQILSSSDSATDDNYDNEIFNDRDHISYVNQEVELRD